MNRKGYLINVAAVLVVLLAATGCEEGARIGDTQTKRQTVERGDAESVNVEIDIGLVNWRCREAPAGSS